MSRITRLAHSISSSLVKNRSRLPSFMNRLIDDVAKNPDGFFGRVATLVLGGGSSALVPPPTQVPGTTTRVYIGPTNYSGQGYLWARALEVDGIGARNMAVELPGGFAFDADTTVPVAVYNRSTSWQTAELAAVEQFTHVLFEAERPIFGSLLGRDVGREIDALHEQGVSCAFLSHGTDIRSPSAHALINRWSPFRDDTPQTRALQADADANLKLLSQRGLPVFVSTPDLLVDAPLALWCPVVVDLDRWAGGRALFSTVRPVVVHVPSMGSIKGTDLIEPVLRGLHEEGVIEYRSVTGVPAREMPGIIADADIVLDQFRIGSYGVAAVEAMAAGRVVVGHVLPGTRQAIRDSTKLALPLVEADPTSLHEVLLDLIADRPAALRAAAEGSAFVRAVHSGPFSARVLREGWIDLPRD